MTTFRMTFPPASRSVRVAPIRGLRRALEAASRRRERRRAAARLLTFDDHLLRDIGITRHDAEEMLRR
jgi:uncharacterized protein YjiS (DUF1127 family)